VSNPAARAALHQLAQICRSALDFGAQNARTERHRGGRRAARQNGTYGASSSSLADASFTNSESDVRVAGRT
jgi:hypothetical protein